MRASGRVSPHLHLLPTPFFRAAVDFRAYAADGSRCGTFIIAKRPFHKAIRTKIHRLSPSDQVLVGPLEEDVPSSKHPRRFCQRTSPASRHLLFVGIVRRRSSTVLAA